MTPPCPPRQETESALKYGSELTEHHLLMEDARCGPLASRIVCAIMQDEELSEQFDEQQMVPETDYLGLEERLKRELKFAGLLDNVDIDWGQREDDEVCVELRSQQQKLREIEKKNGEKKRKLRDLVEREIEISEWARLVEQCDKTLEAGFIKRVLNVFNGC